MTSAPLLLSSAPVGSSARITRPPFMSARAIETRCCWPPDKLVRPVMRAVAQSQAHEQLVRAPVALAGSSPAYTAGTSTFSAAVPAPMRL